MLKYWASFVAVVGLGWWVQLASESSANPPSASVPNEGNPSAFDPVLEEPDRVVPTLGVPAAASTLNPVLASPQGQATVSEVPLVPKLRSTPTFSATPHTSSAGSFIGRTDPNGRTTYSFVPAEQPHELTQIRRLETEAADLARQYRQVVAQQPVDEQQKTQLKDQLQEKLEQAFDLRNQIVSQQLKSLNERMTKLNDSLAKRTEARDQIVNARADALLGQVNELSWEFGVSGPALYPQSVPVVELPSGAPAGPAPAGPTAGPAPTSRLTVPAPAGMGTSPSRLSQPKSTVGQFSSTSDAGVAKRYGNLDQLGTELQVWLDLQLRGIQNEGGKSVQQELTRARQRLEDELKIFEYDLREARLLVDAARAKLVAAEETVKRNPNVSSLGAPNIPELQLEVQLAELRFDRLQSIRDRYEKLVSQAKVDKAQQPIPQAEPKDPIPRAPNAS